jgi:hypothetical protein
VDQCRINAACRLPAGPVQLIRGHPEVSVAKSIDKSV